MPDDTNNNQPPKLVRRREHKKSTMRLGRTIGETREKLETSNERALARKKDKQKKGPENFDIIYYFSSYDYSCNSFIGYFH